MADNNAGPAGTTNREPGWGLAFGLYLLTPQALRRNAGYGFFGFMVGLVSAAMIGPSLPSSWLLGLCVIPWLYLCMLLVMGLAEVGKRALASH